MEIRVLKYFLTVVREGNITKAAELLHITQPTLSRQLMQMEDELCVALFIREKRKIVLTEEGMILKRRAEEIISLAQKAEMEIGNQDHEINGQISIGCGITEATKTMGKLVRKFSEIYPKVSFHIRNGNSDFILENIDNGLIDIGFILEPIVTDKLNYIRLSADERWGVLMKNDSPFAKHENIISSDLKNIPLINSARRETQYAFSNWYGKGYDTLNICATSELTTTASVLVKNNIGSAIVIEGSIDDVLNFDLCFKPLYPPLITHSLIAWKKYQSFNLTVSKFIDFVTNERNI